MVQMLRRAAVSADSDTCGCFCAANAHVYNGADVYSHVGPVKRSTWFVVHASLTWISSDWWMIRYHVYALPQRWCDYNLYVAVNN